MDILQKIQTKIHEGDFRFSDHAIKRMISRRIIREELEQAISAGEIIEEYPDDKYSPTCLIYGMSKSGRHLHVHISVPPKVVVITTYEPDPAEWDNYRIRR
jgi:hypothetical protein